MEDIQKEIEKRAYGFFIERGSQPGHEMEDWIRAEKEVTSKKEHNGTTAVPIQKEKIVKTAFVLENKPTGQKQESNNIRRSKKNFQSVRQGY